ncbi:MAG: TrkA family potassium uptake protein [Ruminococcaceae bacterium]|nr:TrkA family potassium uptake protein [Oscillospiraceae bacterium]
MKSFLVIGMGRFGINLARKLTELGNEVMIVDHDSEKIDELAPEFTDSYIGDCTHEGVVRALGVENFDICFVSMGENFQASLMTTSILKSLGAKMVVSKANQPIQADLLKKIGADAVVYPEKEMAEKLAVQYSADNVFDYINLTGEYSIYETSILSSWAGKTIIELDIRNKYNINIIAVKPKNGVLMPLPGANYRFNETDHIVLIGKKEDVIKLK